MTASCSASAPQPCKSERRNKRPNSWTDVQRCSSRPACRKDNRVEDMGLEHLSTHQPIGHWIAARHRESNGANTNANENEVKQNEAENEWLHCRCARRTPNYWMADSFVEYVICTMGDSFVEYQQGFCFMSVAFGAKKRHRQLNCRI